MQLQTLAYSLETSVNRVPGTGHQPQQRMFYDVGLAGNFDSEMQLDEEDARLLRAGRLVLRHCPSESDAKRRTAAKYPRPRV